MVNEKEVTTIGSKAFYGTKFLNQQQGDVVIGKALYLYNGDIASKEYVVPEGVETICSQALGCQKFNTIVLPKSLKNIDSNAFKDCTELISLDIPSSVQRVSASDGCSKLSVISLQASDKGLELNKFPNAPIKKFYMRRDLTLLTDWMPKLEKLYIGKEVTNIKGGSFVSSSALSELEIEDAKGYIDLGKIPINKVTSFYQGRNIHLAKLNLWDARTNVFSSLAEWEIGENVDSICDDFASYNSYLEDVVLPNHIKYVGKNAFSYNTDLHSFVLPESLTSVEDGLFYGDSKLETISLPNTIRKIGAEAFRGTNIKHLQLPTNLDTIGAWAFGECAIDSIVLPQGCALEQQCFYGTKIKYADVSKMHGNLNLSFAYCKELEEIILPTKEITEIAMEEFWYDHSLTKIVLPNSIQKIGNCAFEATSLEKLEIPESVTEVGVMILGTSRTVPSVYIPGNSNSEKLLMTDSFFNNVFDANMTLKTLQINRDLEYDFEMNNGQDVVVYMDSLIIGAIKSLDLVKSIVYQYNYSFNPTTAICLSPYLTSCDMWKPASGKVLVLPGSKLPAENITYMYTVNKLSYEQSAEGDVRFDGVNNMPYEIVPVFYQYGEETELKEVGVYDLSMKILGTSFDGVYPTGLKVTVASASGINDITRDENNNQCPIYNMNGQRVDAGFRGVVIQNGKKRIVK